MSEKIKYEKIITPTFRAMFPSLFEPNEYADKKRYQVEAVFDVENMTAKDLAAYNRMLEIEKKTFEDFFKISIDQAAAFNYWRVIRSGDDPGRVKYPGYAGKKWAKLTSFYQKPNGTLNDPPGVVDATRKPIGSEYDNTHLVYSGCYMRATGIIKAFNDKSRGVKFVLNNLQKVADGQRLDGRLTAEDEFEAIDPHYASNFADDGYDYID